MTPTLIEIASARLLPNRNPTWRMLSIDAAVAELEDEFGTMRFTAYLSFSRTDGEWEIVEKLYRLHA